MSWTPTISTTENTDTKIGGGPVNNIFRYLKRINLGLINEALEPEVTTPTHFIGRSLRLRDNDDDAELIFDTNDLDLDADVNQYVRWPIITNVESGERRDRAVLEVTQATVKNKTIPISGTDPNIISDPTANATHLAAFNASGQLEKKLFTSYSVSTAMMDQLDMKINRPMRMARVGTWNPETPFGSGALAGCMTIGVDGGISQNTQGKYKILNTRNVANDMVGIAKLDTHTCTRSLDPLLRFAFRFLPTAPASDPVNSRMFKGVGAKRLLTATSDTEPLLSTESGFLFGYGAGDTVFSVFHNDGTGTCVKTPTSASLPVADTNYVLEIYLDAAPNEVVYTLWVTTSGVKNASPLVTGTISTDIPASSTALYLQDVQATANGAVRSYYPHYIEVFV